MFQARIPGRLVLSMFMIGAVCPGVAVGEWMKVADPPDVDKDPKNPDEAIDCWIISAANMLAAAGYGGGASVQESAEIIYGHLHQQFPLSGG